MARNTTSSLSIIQTGKPPSSLKAFETDPPKHLPLHPWHKLARHRRLHNRRRPQHARLYPQRQPSHRCRRRRATLYLCVATGLRDYLVDVCKPVDGVSAAEDDD